MASLHVLEYPDGRGLVLSAVIGWAGMVLIAVENPDQASLACDLVDEPEARVKEVALADVPTLLLNHRTCGVLVVDVSRAWLAATRVEEANHDRPTALVSLTLSGEMIAPEQGKLTVARSGRVSVQPMSSFQPWQRWDLLDPEWFTPESPSLPFIGWVEGTRLWMVAIGERSLCLFGEDPLFGPWASSDGTLMVAQEREVLEHLLHTYEGPVVSLIQSGDDIGASPRIVEVEDLAALLDSLRSPVPPFGVVINPGMPRGMQAIIPPGSRRVLSVFGEFELAEGNVLVPVASAAGWGGYSTIRYGGGPDIQLLPLGRSFCPDPFRTVRSRLDGATDFEVQEFIDEFLGGVASEPLLECFFTDIADVFSMVMWDTIEGIVFSSTFADLAQALAWLAYHERRHDRRLREEGISQPGRIGIGGSGDADVEFRVSQRNQAALASWATGVIARGYRPSDGDQLVRLVNATFRTLHLEMAGFLGDLLWRQSLHLDELPSDHDVDGLDVLDKAALDWDDDDLPGWGEFSPITRGQARDWLKAQVMAPDPRSAASMRERVGADVWDALEPRSRLFLATAYEDYEARGGSPVLDYAPVNLSIVKALEVELGVLLESFRISCPPPERELQREKDELVLARFLLDGVKPTIGQIRGLFRSGDGPLQSALRAHVESVGAADVLGRRFSRGLVKVTDVYRNGGVHDKPISLEVADACMADVLGVPDRVGLLPIAVAWRVGGMPEKS